MNKNERSFQTISVLSGKGGTGKTLISGILGNILHKIGYRVLLVDSDIFVRGLTILLYKQIAGSVDGIPDDITKLTVSGFLREGFDSEQNKWVSPTDKGKDLAIVKLRDYDILPAVGEPSSRLDASLYRTSTDYSKLFTRDLLSAIGDHYDIVIIDCRAGIDNQTLAAASEANMVITVTENDRVGMQANKNLKDALRNDHTIKDEFSEIKNIFTVINKIRYIKSYGDLKKRVQMSDAEDYNTIGYIPFDMDVMQDFGEERLWGNISQTLYFRGLIDFWNEFAVNNRFEKVKEDQYLFPPRILMSKNRGKVPLVQRLFGVFGIGSIICGIIISALKYLKQQYFDPYDLSLYVVVGFGIIFLLLSQSNFRDWIFSKNDNSQY